MIVVDASVILKWVISEPDSAKATALAAQPLSTSALWTAEAGNVLWRYVKLGQLSESEALIRFAQLRAAPMTSVDLEQDAERTFSLSVEIGHPIYDCFYLALAIRESTHVVTADSRFAAAVRRHGKWTSNLKLLSEL